MPSYLDAVLPRWATDWATDGSDTEIVEPTEGKKDIGWVGGSSPDRPPAPYENWLMRHGYEAHRLWRESIWYKASDNWVARDSQLLPTSVDVTCHDLLIRTDLGLILAIGGGTTTGGISSSPDGQTWTQRQAVGSGMYGLATDGDLILSVGGASGASRQIWSSTDGTTWTDRTANFTLAVPDSGFRDVVWDGVNNLWIIWTGGGEIYTASDPTAAAAWTLRHDFGSSTGLVFGDHNPSSGKTIISATNSTPKVSTDGITWSSLILTGSSGTWDPGQGKVQYAKQDGKDVWVIAGRFLDGGQRSGWVFSEDDGVNWESISSVQGYPSYGATGNSPQSFLVTYSPVLRHWLFFEVEGVDETSSRMWAGQPGNPESWSLRTFNPPPTFTDFSGLAQSGVWNTIPSERQSQSWVIGLSANSDEAIIQSDSPLF